MAPIKHPSDDAQPPAVMPALESPRRAYYHTVDSALASLLALKLDPDRITFRRAGRGWAHGRIVGQDVDSHDDIVLSVAGDGLFDRLPTGFRSRGTEREAGVDTLLLAFDDPVEKASSFARQGGLYFDLRPEHSAGCARWIRLFGVSPEDWPVESWYPLARFLPHLHRISGQESGIRLGVKLLLGLEIARLDWQWRRTPLVDEALTRIGDASTRLGVDFVVGRTVEDEAILTIVFGPLTLAEYRRYQSNDMKRLREMVLDLVVPCHLVSQRGEERDDRYSVDWLVGNPDYRPRLATDEENAVVGINMHLGKNSLISQPDAVKSN